MLAGRADFKLTGCPLVFRGKPAGKYDWNIPAKGLSITDYQPSKGGH